MCLVCNYKSSANKLSSNATRERKENCKPDITILTQSLVKIYLCNSKSICALGLWHICVLGFFLLVLGCFSTVNIADCQSEYSSFPSVHQSCMIILHGMIIGRCCSTEANLSHLLCLRHFKRPIVCWNQEEDFSALNLVMSATLFFPGRNMVTHSFMPRHKALLFIFRSNKRWRQFETISSCTFIVSYRLHSIVARRPTRVGEDLNLFLLICIYCLCVQALWSLQFPGYPCSGWGYCWWLEVLPVSCGEHPTVPTSGKAGFPQIHNTPDTIPA